MKNIYIAYIKETQIHEDDSRTVHVNIIKAFTQMDCAKKWMRNLEANDEGTIKRLEEYTNGTIYEATLFETIPDGFDAGWPKTTWKTYIRTTPINNDYEDAYMDVMETFVG